MNCVLCVVYIGVAMSSVSSKLHCQSATCHVSLVLHCISENSWLTWRLVSCHLDLLFMSCHD